MKKIVSLLVAFFAMTSFSACMWDLDSTTDMSVAEQSQSVVVFLHSPTCGYSKAAREYVTETYPNVAIQYIDIDLPGNRGYMKAASQDYGLGKEIATPVICFGNQHIEGWDYNKRQMLDIYIQPYLKK